MKSLRVTEASRAYEEGDYEKALNIYHQVATAMGHRLFFANIALCLENLQPNLFKMDKVLSLSKLEKFEILSELYSSEVVVSVTSYPARIGSAAKSVESLFNQSFRPGRVVLWLAEDQFPGRENDVPDDLKSLKARGLAIKWCDNIRSYKKLLPSLQTYPDKIIVTADDDVVYEEHWLAQLIIAHLATPNLIICHRAHRVVFNDNGEFSPYRIWPKEIFDDTPSFSHLFTGCGGVLYPPESLHPSVHDRAALNETCPHGDDLWFWSMATLNGTRVRIVRDSCFSLNILEGTQDSALWIHNVRGGNNDAMLRSLLAKHPELYQIAGNCPQDAHLVSIVIPVFNTGHYLAQCLDSLLEQSFPNIEILCVDDGSTDDLTQRTLERYEQIDSRIRIIRQQNSGPATARNNGIKSARGAYIALVDSDDYVSSNFIESLYRSAVTKGSDVVVAGKIFCIDKNSHLTEKQSGFESFAEMDKKELASQAIIKTGVSWNKIYKKSFLLSKGIRYLEGANCPSEDNYFSALALAHGYNNISMAADAHYYYRQHDGGITKSASKEGLIQSIGVYDQLLQEFTSSDLRDKQYWTNTIKSRALRDLRYIAANLKSKNDVEQEVLDRFSPELHICCIADKKYIVPTMVFIESLKRSKRKTTSISASVLAPKGMKKEMAAIEDLSTSNFSVKVVEVDPLQFDNLHRYRDENDFCMASPSAMFKFIIPTIFKNLDRILYIDTDLIVRKDLLELFMTSMEDELLCAVPDLWVPVTDRSEVHQFDPYFNSGMMLMNLLKMREEGTSSKLIHAKMNATNFSLMDQDVFNEVCNGRVKTLDVKFNFLPVCYKRHKHRLKLESINRLYKSSYSKVEDIAVDPVIAHWAGSEKPWKSSDTLFATEWTKLFNNLKASGNIEEPHEAALQE